ncbi:Mediator of RNA polymerase II transcription subunit 7 [Coemansia sp. RSA 1813]|nr:Mediator of RNA polymerase II transcription subunit 7 [Coemansia sp. RSA 1646]KAJ1767583.1 Mediator of RNA polymerase II transcription subunit 7 [Coemansia sp. RSA 1843]KAJ2086994.1 Mediator of RNA polymerase II transcription subunit 7 [Coemansia sp. RSA 986]KAJ2215587.1 Mediator of RNA polymerase II transcription subunit 7 [Coemansia sp. RSA 487]KAJ2565442.1 Mediator of RNA polymerase II transcription subunit 7 [Coemansia sp. RSA 1813]
MQDPPQQLDASYPAPPDYFSLFTDANIARAASADTADVLDNSELRFLLPPPPPTSGSYSTFGRTWQVNDRLPSLAEQNIPQLYPDGPIDRIAELKNLNHTVIFEFLDLVDVLIKDPSQYAARTDRIRNIFVNAHHLINEYRDHQAKESLKLMMRRQIDSKRLATEATRAKCAHLRHTIKSLKQGALDSQVSLDVDGTRSHLPTLQDNKDITKPPTESLQSRINSAGLENIAASLRSLT